MERFYPSSSRTPYQLVESEITQQNALNLEELRYTTRMPVSEHLKKAIVTYAFSLDVYTSGGAIYGLSNDDDQQYIPLFDQQARQSETPRQKFSILLARNYTEKLEIMGINPKGAQTTITDNALHHYIRIQELCESEYRIMAEYEDKSLERLF